MLPLYFCRLMRFICIKLNSSHDYWCFYATVILHYVACCLFWGTNHSKWWFFDQTTSFYVNLTKLYFLDNQSLLHLTAHNWQNWKRVFLSCHCHVYSVEAVGRNPILIFWKTWYLSITPSNLNILSYMGDTYNCNFLRHIIIRFYPVDF